MKTQLKTLHSMKLQFLVVCLGFIPGMTLLRAGETSEKKAASAAAPPRVTYKSLADVPEALKSKCEAFGLGMEKAIRDKNTSKVRAAIDRHAIVEAVFEGMSLSDKALATSKEGLERGLQSGSVQLAKTWCEQEPKYTGLALYKGELAARVRLSGEESGITFLDLVVRTNQLGDLVTVNQYNHVVGCDMVEQTRNAMAPVLASMDRSFLEKLLVPGLSSQDIDRFSDLGKQYAAKDWEGAVATYRMLPQSLRDCLPATILFIGALANGGDDEIYRAELIKAAARFKSGNFDFMLVDAYALGGEYAKAAAAVDAFMKRVGDDATLLTLKSLMLCNAGDVAGATKAFQQALKLEPDCLYVRLKGLDVLLAAKDFKGARDSILFLEQNGYDFKGNLTDPVWDEFKKAPESEPWR